MKHNLKAVKIVLGILAAFSTHAMAQETKVCLLNIAGTNCPTSDHLDANKMTKNRFLASTEARTFVQFMSKEYPCPSTESEVCNITYADGSGNSAVWTLGAEVNVSGGDGFFSITTGLTAQYSETTSKEVVISRTVIAAPGDAIIFYDALQRKRYLTYHYGMWRVKTLSYKCGPIRRCRSYTWDPNAFVGYVSAWEVVPGSYQSTFARYTQGRKPSWLTKAADDK